MMKKWDLHDLFHPRVRLNRFMIWQIREPTAVLYLFTVSSINVLWTLRVIPSHIAMQETQPDNFPLRHQLDQRTLRVIPSHMATKEMQT